MTKVKVIWFKPSGKYYSEGEYEVNDNEFIWDTFGKFKENLKLGIRPGLVDSKNNEFFAVVTVGDQAPALFLPTAIEGIKEFFS